MRLRPSWVTATLLGLMSYVAYAEFLRTQRRGLGAGNPRLFARRQSASFRAQKRPVQVHYGA